MNVKALRQVQEQIKAEPRRFFMSWWLNRYSEVAPCGTAACIGGWAILNQRAAERNVAITSETLPALANSVNEYEVADEAQDLIDINPSEAYRLFDAGQWPEPWRTRYLQAPTGSKEAAQAAIERIDHFIWTEGRE